MSKRENTIQVWDIGVRLFHWSLVASFIAAYFTQSDNYDLHLYTGYALLGLIAFRLLWGFVGSRYARFSSFLFSPAVVAGYLRDMAQRRARRYLGHNPAGAAMIVLLLLCLLTIGISGVALDAAENRAGPLGDTRLFFYTDLINEIHNWSTDITLALIALHILGVIFSSVAHRESLVRAMITGRKAAQQGDE